MEEVYAVPARYDAMIKADPALAQVDQAVEALFFLRGRKHAPLCGSLYAQAQQQLYIAALQAEELMQPPLTVLQHQLAADYGITLAGEVHADLLAPLVAFSVMQMACTDAKPIAGRKPAYLYTLEDEGVLGRKEQVSCVARFIERKGPVPDQPTTLVWFAKWVLDEFSLHIRTAKGNDLPEQKFRIVDGVPVPVVR